MTGINPKGFNEGLPFVSSTLGFYRDHHWPLDREDGGKVLDMRGGVQGELKNGAQIVADPDLGDVVSLKAPEAWLLMGEFKGILDSFSTSVYSIRSREGLMFWQLCIKILINRSIPNSEPFFELS